MTLSFIPKLLGMAGHRRRRRTVDVELIVGYTKELFQSIPD